MVPRKIWRVFGDPNKTDWLRRVSVCPAMKQRLKRSGLCCLNNLCYWPETKSSRQAWVTPAETWTGKHFWAGWMKEVACVDSVSLPVLGSSVTWPSGEACCCGSCSSACTRPSGPRSPSRPTCWGRSVPAPGSGDTAQHSALLSPSELT